MAALHTATVLIASMQGDDNNCVSVDTLHI